MCFSPQRRAIFPQRNFKKWSETVSFLTFSLANVLLATAACNFSTSQLQKAVRPWGVLYILTWKCSSRYSGVQFFHIATSKNGPNLLCFVHFDLKMCFSLQRRAIFHVFSQQPPPHPPLYRGYFSTQPTHKSLKNAAFRDFPNISRLWIFFLLTFAQLLYLLSSDSTSLLCFFIFWLCYSALLFQLSILSEVRLLNFLRLIYWYSWAAHLCFYCYRLKLWPLAGHCSHIQIHRWLEKFKTNNPPMVMNPMIRKQQRIPSNKSKSSDFNQPTLNTSPRRALLPLTSASPSGATFSGFAASGTYHLHISSLLFHYLLCSNPAYPQGNLSGRCVPETNRSPLTMDGWKLEAGNGWRLPWQV